jgi:hypothetical protein
MAASSTYYPHQVNFSNIRLDANLFRQAKGGSFSKLFYERHPKLSVQTPKLYAPSGIGCFDGDTPQQKKYSLLLSLNPDSAQQDDLLRQQIEQFQDFWRQLDEQIINECLRHINSDGAARDWANLYPKKYSKEVFEDGFFRPFLKQGKNKKTGELYPPSISIKMNPIRDKEGNEVFRTTFWLDTNEPLVITDENGDELPKSPDFIQRFIPPRSSVVAILDIEGIWIVDKKVSVSVKLNAVKVSMAEEQPVTTFLPPISAEQPSYLQDQQEEVPAEHIEETVAASASSAAATPSSGPEPKRSRTKK